MKHFVRWLFVLGGCFLPLSASALPLPLTTGAFTATVTDSAILLDGPQGRQSFAFFPVDSFFGQFLNDQGQYIGSAETHLDGFAFYAVYGVGFGVLSYDFPYNVGDFALGTYGDFSGHVRYAFAGPPSATGDVTATVEVGYIGSDYFQRNYAASWTLPAASFAATPEPGTLLLVGSLGLLLCYRKVTL